MSSERGVLKRVAEKRKSMLAVVSILLLSGSGNALAQGVDWKVLPVTEATLFHPGQTSLQWVLDPARHTGASGFRKAGMECLACHLSRAEQMGKKIMNSRALEPAPLLWRREHVSISVQMHFENDAIHLRVRFPRSKLQPHERMQESFESRLTVMISDDQVRSAARAGCWSACHADMREMPAAAGQKTGKYIIDSRPDPGPTGGGAEAKSAAELQSLMASGTFLEVWQASLMPDQSAVTRDGYILENLHFNEDPAVTSHASLVDSTWTVEFDRPASADGARKHFRRGQRYTIGFALHDQYTAGRYHLVSQTYRFTVTSDGIRFEPLL